MRLDHLLSREILLETGEIPGRWSPHLSFFELGKPLTYFGGLMRTTSEETKAVTDPSSHSFTLKAFSFARNDLFSHALLGCCFKRKMRVR